MKVIALFSALLMSAALNANPMLYRYHIPESAQDHRYDYHWALLKLALDQTSAQYGDYQLEPAPLVMSESRQFQALGGPLLSVMISPADIENEKRFLPVRIPLDKGLIGYRVLLIRKERQAEFSRINNLEQLRKLTVGQGRDWRDVRVWQDNGFEVVQGSNYNGLFQMLLSGRFDFFREASLRYRTNWPSDANRCRIWPLKNPFLFTIRGPFISTLPEQMLGRNWPTECR